MYPSESSRCRVASLPQSCQEQRRRPKHGRRGRDLKLFPGERENSFRTKEPFLSSNSAAPPRGVIMRMGANHSFIHLNPLSMLARRMKEGRMLPKVKALLGMIGPKGKGRSGILCGACKRALAGIAPRGWPPRIFRISSCIQILSEAPEGFDEEPFRHRRSSCTVIIQGRSSLMP